MVLAQVSSLIWAARNNDLNQVQRLVLSGVDPDVPDYDGRTALHLAAAEGHDPVVRFLLSRDVNESVHDRWGSTPRDEAVRMGHIRIATMLEEYSQSRGRGPPMPLLSAGALSSTQ
jgi:glutaminase